MCKILCSNESTWEGEKITSDSNDQSEEHVETDENDDSDTETDDHRRFSFTRTIHDEAHIQKKNISKLKKTNSDDIAAETEFERVVANYIKHMVKWRKLHAKKELKCEQNDKIDTWNHSWGINVKVLLDHLIQESGEER